MRSMLFTRRCSIDCGPCRASGGRYGDRRADQRQQLGEQGVDGRIRPDPHDRYKFNRVSEDYFKTLGIPLVAGRDFSPADTLASTPVAIVDETFARTLGGDNAVGRRFKVEPTPSRPQEATFGIVGVARNSKYFDLREIPRPVAYLCSRQAPRAGAFVRLVARHDLPSTQLASTLAGAIADVHPGIVVSFTSLKAQISDTLLRERLMATLSGFFGGVAALLAVVGLYGVIAYTVARRTKKSGSGLRSAPRAATCSAESSEKPACSSPSASRSE